MNDQMEFFSTRRVSDNYTAIDVIQSKCMTRNNDPATSHQAAERVKPEVTRLQESILAAFKDSGDMTDEELCLLPQFWNCKDSTIRTRRHELCVKGLVVSSGTTKDGQTVWRKSE